jgi:hypothetical protein
LFPICKRTQKAPAGSTTHHPPPAFFDFRLARSTIASPPSFLPSFLSFLPSFDSNPLTQTASQDKKSPAKDDHAKSLQKWKIIQTRATVLDLWSKER